MENRRREHNADTSDSSLEFHPLARRKLLSEEYSQFARWLTRLALEMNRKASISMGGACSQALLSGQRRIW